METIGNVRLKITWFLLTLFTSDAD